MYLHIKKIAVSLLLLFGSFQAEAEKLPFTQWKTQWNFDKMNDAVTCSMFSNKIFFKGKYGVNSVYMGVQGDGAVSIHTEKDAFDSDYISSFGIRVGKNAAIYGPTYISPSLVKFSLEKSKALIEQLYVFNTFTIQVAFFPEFHKVNKTLHTGVDTSSFQSVLMSRSYCEAIKDSDGWVGVAFTDLKPDPSFIEKVEKYTKYSSPGVVVWTVHPRKQGGQSGIRPFDVILAADSVPINTITLLERLKSMQTGEIVQLSVLRGKKAKTIKLSKP